MTSVSLSSQARVKHSLRGLLDLGFAATGLLHWHERMARSGLTILMYHRVLPAEDCAKYPLASLVMPAEAFAEQIAWLARCCRVRPLAEALAELKYATGDPKPLVAVTFDDGYEDNFEYAAPILDTEGVRATFFVTSGFVETSAPFWFDLAADAWTRLSENDGVALYARMAPDSELAPGLSSWMATLKRLPIVERDMWIAMALEGATGQFVAERYAPMTVEQVAELSARGHEIGSHSVNHPILPLLSDDELDWELTASRARLAELVGGDITGFCYPNGDFDSRVAAATVNAGYSYACGTEEGMNSPSSERYSLRRRPVSMRRVFGPTGQHSILGFRAELCGQRDWLR